MKAPGSRPFGALLAATLFSVSGDGITQIGVPWLVLLNTGSAGKAGVVALCTMLPAGFGALFGGTLADRSGARRLSIISDLACCLSVGSIPILQLAGTLKFWELCVLMAVTGLVHAPGNAARSVLLPAVARRCHVPVLRATGFYAGASRAASIIGSAAGGIVITTLGAAHALFIDAGTFAVSAVLIWTGIRWADVARPGQARRSGPPRSRRRYRNDVSDGIRLVAATPLLLGITVVTLAAQGLDQGWSTVILPVDVRDKLHSVVALGAAETAFALGALAGALAYTALAERLPRWPVFTLGFIIVGMPRFAIAALTASPAPLVIVMAVEGIACGPLNPIASSVMYQLTPESMRGSASGTMTGTALMATPFGALAAGALIDSIGLTTATVLFGGVYLVVTLVPALLPVYRQISEPAASGQPAARPPLGGQQAVGRRAR